VAVSVRLAAAIKQQRPQWHVRLFSDGQAILPRLFSGLANTSYPQLYKGVEILPLTAAGQKGGAAVALEMLGCELPEGYARPTYIINVEYLTAEGWASEYHLHQSYIGGRSKKFFFLPGVTRGTGGLVWGGFLDLRKAIEEEPLQMRKDFLRKMKLPPLDVEQNWASLYTYEIDRNSIEAQKETLFITPDTNMSQPLPANCYVCPNMGLEWYDCLVLLSDYNFVRGEDSLSRALLAGKPFLWQAYRQENNLHLVKVQAMLDVFQPSFYDTMLYTLLEKQFISFNKSGYFDPNFFGLYKTELGAVANDIAGRIISLDAQENNLIRFVEELNLSQS
jgi:hypothetical protein